MYTNVKYYNNRIIENVLNVINVLHFLLKNEIEVDDE